MKSIKEILADLNSQVPYINKWLKDIRSKSGFHIFEFHGLKVHSIYINNEYLFYGNDISKPLKYKIPHKAVEDHVADKDKIKIHWKDYNNSPLSNIWGSNDFSDKTFINKSGIYSIIVHSYVNVGKHFKYWLTHYVLPNTDEALEK